MIEAFGPNWLKENYNLEEIGKIATIAANLRIQQKEDDFVWKKLSDYEKTVGYSVNEAVRIGWDMARTTNKMIESMK